MMLNKYGFIGADAEYDEADMVIFGAPFDGTTSFRAGTRFGPGAIRSESFGIETYSPYQDEDLEDLSVCDLGDLDLPFGNTERVLCEIENTEDKIYFDGKIPVMLGGEHLVTLGAVRAAVKKYKDLYILHFDAHTDLRDEYIGEKLSHANVIRRAWELVGDEHIYQFGIRSGEKHEFEFAKEHNIIEKFSVDTVGSRVEELKGKKVYLTLDLDVLDPSVFSGTGTPEAGGVTFKELLSALLKLKGLDIVGADINELSPDYDRSGVSTAVACKLLREILLIIGGKN